MTAAWIMVNVAAAGVTFAAGFMLGHDQRPAPVTRIEYQEVPAGDFQDIELVMRSSGGNTFRWSCDLHLDGTDDHAECEYAP